MATFDVRVHAKLDGTNWSDISSSVQYEDRIQIRAGAGNQGGRIDTSTCGFRLRNSDGEFTPGNPVSSIYPNWDLGTPVRVSVHEGGVALLMEGAASSGASTPDTAALDIAGDIDVRIDLALWNLEYPQITGSVRATELIGKFSGAPNKSWFLSVRDGGYLVLEWSADGTNSLSATSTDRLRVPGSNPRMTLRATLDVNNGAGGHTVRFYRSDSITGDWEQIGEDVVGSGVTSIANSTAALQIGNATAFAFTPLPQGSFYKAEVRDGIGGTVVANPDFTAQAPATTSFADGAGRTWSTFGAGEITDRKTRFEGEVASLAPGRTQKNFLFVDVEAGGRMRRLGANDEKLKSAVYRDITSPTRQDIIAYWPMEDGSDADDFSSPFAGVDPADIINPSGVELAAYTLWGASSPIPTFTTGYMAAPMPAYTVTGETSTRFFMALPSGGVPATRSLIALFATGTGAVWLIDVDTAGGLQLRVVDEAGASVYTSGFTAFALNGTQRTITMELTQNGANVDWRIVSTTVSFPLTLSLSSGTVPSRTVGRVKSVRLNDGRDMSGTALGQLTVADEIDAYLGSSESVANWKTEGSVERVARLCEEEDIPIAFSGFSEWAQGGQGESDLVTLLRDVAATEQALLGETRHTLGLFYRTPDSLASQDPAMTIPYTSTSVVNPFQPVYDDSEIVNDFTASRRDGGFSRYRELEGRRSVSDPPSGVGPYEGSDTFNVAYEEQTGDLAGWPVHLGTFEGARFSGLRVRLDKNLTLVDDFCRAYIGDVFKMSSVPLDLAGTSDIKLRVEGYRESIDQFEWIIDYVMSPGEPWDTGFAGHDSTAFREDEFAWADTEQSELSEALTSTETDVDILTTAGPQWTSDPFDSPYDLRAAGEIMTVQAPGSLASANPFFTTDTTGWSGAGASIARSTVVVHPHPRAVASLAVTPDGVSVFALARTDLSAVDTVVAGQRYTISCWVRVTATTADVRPTVEWFTSAGASISSSGGAQSANAGEWTFIQETVTAPATASRYRLGVQLGGTPASSAVFYTWAPRLTLTLASAVFDEFGRTATDTWASADSGQAWTNTGGAAADYDVLSGYGRHTHPAASVGHHSVTAAPHASFDIYCDLAVAATSTGASQFAGILARYVDVDNLYEARLDFTTTGSVNLTLRERAAAVEAALATATAVTTYTAGTFLRCRFQGYGTALKAKAWLATDEEPAAWQVEATDGTLTGAGSLGVKTVRNAGNTNASADIRADNFNLITPQSFVVIRSVNGVTKAQSSGADIRLAFPAVPGI